MKYFVAVAATALFLSVAGADGSGQDGLQSADNVNRDRFWPDGRFVYELSPEVASDPVRRRAFETACRALVDGSRLACVPRDPADPPEDHVLVVDGPSNHSMIGRQGGRQILSIRGWNNPVKVAHEIKHALGWAHEHQHPQRDRFVEILYENIPPSRHRHFERRDLGNEGPYDFDSIMHYYPTDLALPARRAIRARPAYAAFESRMGQRDHLSEIDLLEIRNVYGAADAAPDRAGPVSRAPTSH